MKRKIVVVTGSRAEYGLLKNTMREIDKSRKLELYIIVTGTHILKEYGYTYMEIQNDGFNIYGKIGINKADNGANNIAEEMGVIMIGLSGIINKIKPDIMLILGDRYEMLAAASTAVGMHIPIAHISGGEVTEGAIDDQIRHAITKMAHIHFPGAMIYANNIRKMGEESWRIFNVGDPAIENIKLTPIILKEDLEKELGISIDRKTLLVTYHPVTLELSKLNEQMDNLIMALRKHTGSVIITYPNGDEGSSVIVEKWNKFAKEKDNVCIVKSLGIKRYVNVMRYCGAVVGNSSSAIIEAPFLKVPVVNIGNRQKGRVMAENIYSCGYETTDIDEALKNVLSEEFRKKANNATSIYGEGETSKEIVKVLETIKIDDKLLKKKLCW